MLKNFRKAAVAASFVCMLCAVPAQAATLDHAEVYGFEQLDEETKTRISTALEQVPQEVLDLQKAKGGSIVFKNQVMDENGNAVSGLYWLSGPDANDINTGVSTQTAVKMQKKPLQPCILDMFVETE